MKKSLLALLFWAIIGINANNIFAQQAEQVTNTVACQILDRINALEKKVDGNITATEKKLEKIETRLGGKIYVVKTNFNAFKEESNRKLDTMNNNFPVLVQSQKDIADTLKKVSEKTDGLSIKQKNLSEQIRGKAEKKLIQSYNVMIPLIGIGVVVLLLVIIFGLSKTNRRFQYYQKLAEKITGGI